MSNSNGDGGSDGGGGKGDLSILGDPATFHDSAISSALDTLGFGNGGLGGVIALGIVATIVVKGMIK